MTDIPVVLEAKPRKRARKSNSGETDNEADATTTWLRQSIQQLPGYTAFKKNQNKILKDSDIPDFWGFAAKVVQDYYHKSPSKTTVRLPFIMLS